MSFYKDYLMLNLGDFDSFGGFDFYITIFLLVLAAVLCVGAFISNSRKNVMIRTVKQLFRHGARTEDKAKTLKELGINPTARVSHIIESSTLMKRAVKRVGEREMTYEEYVASTKKKKNKKKIKALQKKQVEATVDTAVTKESICDARFYSPVECEAEAKRILSKRETSLLQDILVSLLIISLCVCLTFLLPELLELIDGVLS